MSSINFVVLLFLMIGIGGIRGEPSTSSPINEYNNEAIQDEITQEDGIEDTTVSSIHSQFGFPVIELVLRRGQSDTYNCRGIYYRADPATKVRGMPVYYNKKRQRFIFFDGRNYVITSYYYWRAIFFSGARGGYYWTRNHYPRLILSSNWGPKYYIRHRYVLRD